MLLRHQAGWEAPLPPLAWLGWHALQRGDCPLTWHQRHRLNEITAFFLVYKNAFKQQNKSPSLSQFVQTAANWYGTLFSLFLSLSPLLLLTSSFSSSLLPARPGTAAADSFFFIIIFSLFLLSYFLPFSSSLPKIALWQHIFILITMYECIVM